MDKVCINLFSMCCDVFIIHNWFRYVLFIGVFFAKEIAHRDQTSLLSKGEGPVEAKQLYCKQVEKNCTNYHGEWLQDVGDVLAVRVILGVETRYFNLNTQAKKMDKQQQKIWKDEPNVNGMFPETELEEKQREGREEDIANIEEDSDRALAIEDDFRERVDVHFSTSSERKDWLENVMGAIKNPTYVVRTTL